MQRPRKQYPSLRRGLLRLHTDLLTIHGTIDPYAYYFSTELSLFERCVLVLEDRRFFRHMGIDWLRVVRETLKAATFQRHGGASTLDMQFVRTATGYRRPTISRKLYEMLLAYIIQHRYSKVAILRSYLEIAYFGTGLRGATNASYSLYGSHPLSLQLDQAAALAAMLVFPRPRNPNETWTKKHLRRTNYIKAVYVRRKQRLDQLEKRIFL
jgi:membrane peptidoglycan carboxypeptidase